MKKFLFTLAALLLAGNAFAYKAGDAVTNEYFYIEPVELTQADIDAGEVEVTVFVHAEAYFNVFMIDIVPPAGLTPVEYWDEDAMTVSYKNNRGSNKTVNGNLAANDEMTRFIATISVGGYWQPEEGGAWEQYGAVKWEAGDYAMFTVLYEIDADAIADGQFYIHSYPASGQDDRGYVSDGRETEAYYDVTVPSAPQEKTANPTILATAGDQCYTVTITAPVEDPDAVLYYRWHYIDDEGFDYGWSDWEIYTNELLFLMYGTHDIQAYALADGKLQSNPVGVQFFIDENTRPEVIPGSVPPAINVEQPADYTSATVTITATEGATIMYSFDNANWEEYTDPVLVTTPGEYTVYAFAVGPNAVSEVVTADFTVLAPAPQEKTGTPSVQATYGDECYTVTITAPADDPDAVLYYRCHYTDIEGFDYGWSDWEIYTNELLFLECGIYDVQAYALADGKLQSNPVGVQFVIDAPTGVDEVLGGKTVAGTRYFNLAGQEMSEPNGVCIIVTTYTDGTTSAVKVMK